MKKKTVAEYDIHLNKKLGSGAYGGVYEGFNRSTLQRVAVKMIDKSKIHMDNEQYMAHALKREVLIISKISSEHVVGFKDILVTKRYYYIVQQLCDHDLRTFLKQNPKLPQEKAIELLTMFLNGYYALIVTNVIHRDIKPENILFKNKILKIADFGFSRTVSQNQLATSSVGTKTYSSPQIIFHSQYTTKCDVWSFGVLFYQMLYGKLPFKSAKQLKQQCEQFQFPNSPKVSEEAKQIMRNCFKYEQKDRADWDYLFNHPFFIQNVPNFNKLDKRLAYIISIMRNQIVEKNIDLLALFKMVGFQKDKEISYNLYEKMITKLVPATKITKQQIQYSFNYFDEDKNKKISFDQLCRVLQAHGVHFTALPQQQFQNKFISQVKLSDPESKTLINEESLTPQQFNHLKLEETVYQKVIDQLKTKKYENLQQKFALADLTECGLVLNVFSQFLRQDLKLKLTKQQCQIIFRKLDQDKSETITFDEFQTFICKAINLPINIQQSKESVKKGS